MPDYFISDLHLSDETPQRVHMLQSFVEAKRQDIENLYVLGDLFEAWVGDDCTTRCSENCATIFRNLSKVYFLAGNRDFLLGEQYARHANMVIIHEPYAISLAGEHALLLHGDVLCTDDVEHQQMRNLVLTDKWQQDFLSLPLEERIRQAIAARAKSTTRQQGLSTEIIDVNQQAVKNVIQQHSVTTVLHGHTHKAAIHTINNSDRRIVLGDWNTYGWYASADDSNCQLVSFTCNNNRIDNERVLASFGNN